MNKSMIVGTLLGAVAVTATGTMASFGLLGRAPQYAEVLQVQPVNETIRTPRQECYQEEVVVKKPTQDPNQVAGTAIGALVGGLLGSQVGGGNGKKLATLAGAAAGGYAGNQVQKNLQAKDTYTKTEERCTTVTDTEQKLVGYDVEYRLGDQVAKVRMDHDPGERIPVKDGELVLSQAPAASNAPTN